MQYIITGFLLEKFRSTHLMPVGSRIVGIGERGRLPLLMTIAPFKALQRMEERIFWRYGEGDTFLEMEKLAFIGIFPGVLRHEVIFEEIQK